MSAPAKMLTTRVGEATITMPEELAALAYVEKMLGESRPMSIGVSDFIQPLQFQPPIGANWNGGKYAGLTIHSNVPYGLVLLPGDLEEADWKKALAWCEEQGGLPASRFDLLVLWQNLRSELKPEAHWSGEECAGGPGCAWYQDFSTGDQLWAHESLKLRVVAVRRVAI